MRCQLLHVGVDLVQDVVALLEQRVLGTHEGQHLQQTQGHIYASPVSVSPPQAAHSPVKISNTRVISGSAYCIQDFKLLLGLKHVYLPQKRGEEKRELDSKQFI